MSKKEGSYGLGIPDKAFLYELQMTEDGLFEMTGNSGCGCRLLEGHGGFLLFRSERGHC